MRFHVWKPEEREFMASVVPGRSWREIQRLVNDRFGLSLTEHQIKGYITRSGLKTGRDGRFKAGTVPHNKGVKGQSHPGSVPTQFRTGNVPANRVPIGTEKLREDGYVYVKVKDGCKNANWKQKHIVIWEREYGPLPDGHVLIFADGDLSNVRLDNLILASRKDLVRFNQMGYKRESYEGTQAGLLLAGIRNRIGERKKAAR